MDGYLLNKLGSAYERFGIEVNATMRGRAAASGITVLGDDLLDHAVIEANTGRFDIVTCVAVFEHLRDFRGGFEAALQMLEPAGVLILRGTADLTQRDNSAWYTSSLEHVYYPTEGALHYLVEQELGAPLIGAEIPIKHYASTYIGIVPKRSADAAWLSELFARIRGTGPAPLSAAERVAKMQLSLVHAANGDSSDVLALAELSPKSVTVPLLKRLGQLGNWTARNWPAQRSAPKPWRRPAEPRQPKHWQKIRKGRTRPCTSCWRRSAPKPWRRPDEPRQPKHWQKIRKGRTRPCTSCWRKRASEYWPMHAQSMRIRRSGRDCSPRMNATAHGCARLNRPGYETARCLRRCAGRGPIASSKPTCGSTQSRWLVPFCATVATLSVEQSALRGGGGRMRRG